MNDSRHTDFSPSSAPNVDTLKRLAISESGFVFDPVSGHHFTVNETGLVLLRYLQKEAELAIILDTLSQVYDVSKRNLERDVLEFTGLLKDYVGE
jgi:hypothetical protein